MSEVNVQIQNPQQTVNINNPSIVIEVAEQSIEVEFSEQNIEIQVQNPVIEVNIGGPCDCGDGGGGHEIQDEGTPLTQRGALNFVGAGVTVTDDSANNRTVVTIPGGGGTWGSITGTLSDQTDLQTALDGKVDENAAITGATKTKITYDAKGLVTAGADAGIADITGLQTALDGKAASSHTHPLADITDAGALAALSTVDTAEITNDAVTNEKAANMAAWTVKGRNNAASGDPQDIGVADLTEEASPAAGDMLFGWESGGALRKFDIGNLPGGPGGASYTEITYADMATAITNSTLTPGGWYLITDAAGTDLGFLTYAVTENQISVAGVGGYLNADFQAVGDYTGVEAITGIAASTQLGIWRTSFEAITISYVNLQFPADYVSYSTSSGLLDPAETFTTDLGTTGEVITDDGAGTVTVQNLSQALVAGEVITGDNSGNTVTVDSYTVTAKVFAVGDTITGGTTGATAVILSDDGVSSMTAYMTSAGVAFNGSEVLDNGAGVTADQDGAATGPTIVLGDCVIWNLLHYQLTDAAMLNGDNPENNTDAYTLLDKATYPETYVTAWDVSEYDFANDSIEYRQDLRGGLVRGAAGIQGYQFGRDDWYNNTITNPLLLDIINLPGSFYENVVLYGASIHTISSLGSFEIAYNTLGLHAELSEIECRLNAGVYSNDIGSYAKIKSILIGENRSIESNTVFPGGSIESIYGNVEIRGNIVQNRAQLTGIETGLDCIIENNILENGASLSGITAGANCSISRNKVGQGATLGGSTTMGDAAYINDNELSASAILGQNCQLGAGAFLDKNIVGLNSQIVDCTLMAGASIGSSLLYSQISNCTIGENSYIYVIATGGGVFNTTIGDNSSIDTIEMESQSSISDCTIGDGASMQYIRISQNSYIVNKTIDDAVSFSDKIIGITMDETETITDSITGKRAIPGYSDIPGTIDITGLTTLDCTAAFAQYRGIYNLTSSNATESIDTITNPPTAFPFTLRPDDALTLTITGTAYSGIAAGQIALKAASYVLDGSKGEYIVLEIDPLGSGALIEKYVVNGLI